jgi:hypothetical protein
LSTDQLLVPPRIRVGAQKRNDTYTGQLGYVIYYDSKGVLRKEKSWEAWRSKDIEPVEYPNVPTEGFVLNKNGGGAGGGHHWDARQAFIRVYDPRGFEFEIGVANLLFILREGGCSPGKGLEGKFVYAWEGTTLVLLPCNSADYQSSVEFTGLKDKSVHMKTLVFGATYITKKQDLLVYLGRYRPLDLKRDGHGTKGRWDKLKGDPFVFLDTSNQPEGGLPGPYVYMPDLRDLAECRNPDPVPNLAELTDEWLRSPSFSPIVRLELADCGRLPDTVVYARHTTRRTFDPLFYGPGGRPDEFYVYMPTYTNDELTSTLLLSESLSLSGGRVTSDHIEGSRQKDYWGYDRYENLKRPKALYEQFGQYRLRATLASGEVWWFHCSNSYSHLSYYKFVRDIPLPKED